MPQYGFFIDTSRCIGCNACVLACKQWHDIPPGPAKPIRVHQWEQGAFPGIEVNVLPLMCMHCKHPRCMDACEHGAIYKEEKYGAVLVDQEKCQGDRKCYAACPYGAPQYPGDEKGDKMLKCTMCIDRLEQGLSPLCVLSCSMRALDFGVLEDLTRKYGDEGSYMLLDESPCHNACPAGVNAQAYINRIAEGDCDGALKEYYKITPLAGVLGRICTHVCEVDCFRGRFDNAVSVRELKRYMAGHVQQNEAELLPKKAGIGGKRIAVVGSGPSGLACAYRLALLNYDVDVFEKQGKPGGMMRYGIPSYRLPNEVLEKEIALIEGLGVRIHTEQQINDVEALLKDYSAVYVATGCSEGIQLAVPGEDSPHIHSAIDFLFGLNSGGAPLLGKRVAVIGGGNVAMDAARSVVRLGNKEVNIISLETLDMKSKDRMTAQEEEVTGAQEEGVVFHPGYSVSGFEASANGIRILCNTCTSVRDADGTFRPQCDPAPSFSVEVDDVLVAIGQKSDEAAFPTGLPKGPRGALVTAHFASEAKGIFAGGDLVSGPSDCISAIAVGNEAAKSIDLYCRGQELSAQRRTIPKSNRPRAEKRSMAAPAVPIQERVTGFREATRPLGTEAAMEQAQRCLRCGSMLPSALFRREQPKRDIVPWDKTQALLLWTKRHPETGECLPDILDSIPAALEQPEPGTFCRDRLVLRPATASEKMLYTTDDE